MKKILLIAAAILLLCFSTDVRSEELPLVCELKEVLNFKSPVQVIFLTVDMENRTVNGIPSTVYRDYIITYETKTESLTIVLPSMEITIVRKGQGAEGSSKRYTGACYKDKFNF